MILGLYQVLSVGSRWTSIRIEPVPMTWLPPGQASKDNSGNGPSGCCDVPQTGRVLPLDTVVQGKVTEFPNY